MKVRSLCLPTLRWSGLSHRLLHVMHANSYMQDALSTTSAVTLIVDLATFSSRPTSVGPPRTCRRYIHHTPYNHIFRGFLLRFRDSSLSLSSDVRCTKTCSSHICGFSKQGGKVMSGYGRGDVEDHSGMQIMGAGIKLRCSSIMLPGHAIVSKPPASATTSRLT